MEPENNNHTPAQQEEVTTSTKKLNISIPAAIITGAAIIGLAIIFTLSPKGTITKQQPTIPDDTTKPTTVTSDTASVRQQDYVNGDRNAEVVILEYSDSDCPYCKQFHDTMKQTVANYKGKVAWVYRFFPLTSLHPNAYTEAVALSCVGELGGNTAFWKYMDTVIGVTLTPDAKSNEALTTFASQVGVDSNLFNTCAKAKNNNPRVDADITEAQSIGARGTPYSIAINQKTGKQVVIPGAVPIESLKQTIDSLLR